MKKLSAIISGLAIVLTMLVAAPQAATAAPKSQSAEVVLSGVPEVNGTLFADVTGLKTGTRISYSWKVGNQVVGTESSLYLGDASFDGAVIKLAITAKKSGYKDFKYTSASITEGSIARLKAGEISGSLYVGSTLSANCGTFLPQAGDGAGQSLCSVQWQADGSNLSGETDNSLILTSEHIGRHISAVTTITSGELAPMNPIITKAGVVQGYLALTNEPTFNNVSLVGSRIELVDVPNFDSTPTTVKYQWYRSGKAISKATSSSYTISESDWHKSISVKITASKTNYVPYSDTWTVVARVLKVGTKTSSAISGNAGWDSCDYANESSYDCWQHTTIPSQAVAWNQADYEDDYTLMNLSAYAPVASSSVYEWRAIVTGTTSTSLAIVNSTDEGIEFVDVEGSAFFNAGSTSWTSSWTSIAATDDDLFHLGLYINDYGGFIVKTLKIQVRYIY